MLGDSLVNLTESDDDDILMLRLTEGPRPLTRCATLLIDESGGCRSTSIVIARQHSSAKKLPQAALIQERGQNEKRY